MTYRNRRLVRADRLRTWADKRRQRSTAAFSAAHRLADAIPFGQPILVGHHSERHARRDAARIHSTMSAGVEHQRKAADMASRADEIERQADAAIYSDDPDAIERLTEKIAELEAERERIKTINRFIRKVGFTRALTPWPAGETCPLQPPITDAERADLLAVAKHCPWHRIDSGYPPYKLQNLGGNITRARQRLEHLSGGPARPTAPTVATSTADTATARAGLTVTAGMTTPTRPGKQPRPVWTVTGNLAFWRPLLMQLGGTWYRGAFSFWDDPTDTLERSIADDERVAAGATSTPGPSSAQLAHEADDPHCTCPDCLARLEQQFNDTDATTTPSTCFGVGGFINDPDNPEF